jgi:hypothetical protein
MRAGFALLISLSTCASGPAQPLEQVLSRLSEEAEAFRLAAPNLLAREKLVQRAVRPPKRFRPRLGNAALGPPKPQYRTREVISEYAFASLREAPGALHEFRQVVTADNRRVATPEKAQRTLAAGLRSDDDRLQKQLLENFEKYGLTGAASDFGQTILLFTRRRLADYAFLAKGSGRIGADQARILTFRQTGGAASFAVFERRQAVHEPLQGEIWLRVKDWMPLRVVLVAERKEGATEARDEATVDYATTPQGHLAPVSVTHREKFGDAVVVENQFQYPDFRLFQAQTEVEFSDQGKKR